MRKKTILHTEPGSIPGSGEALAKSPRNICIMEPMKQKVSRANRTGRNSILGAYKMEIKVLEERPTQNQKCQNLTSGD